MARVVVPFIFLLLLATVPVADAVTPIDDDNNPGGEDDLYEVVNTMMGTSFTSSAQLGTYEIDCDEWWFEWDGDIVITATYAGQDQELWWENSTDSGYILMRSTDGYDYTSVVFNTIGGDFYFKDITNGNTWYSRDDLNSDGETHMVTYDMRAYEFHTFICALEDVSGLGDGDFNDLVFKMTFAAPSCICTDNDGDTYAIEGGPCGPVDCDDADPSVNPGITEECDDGTDNDCDGDTDCNDSDCAGVPPCNSYGTCAVGGVASMANKTELLAPWLALTALILVSAGMVVIPRLRKTS